MAACQKEHELDGCIGNLLFKSIPKEVRQEMYAALVGENDAWLVYSLDVQTGPNPQHQTQDDESADDVEDSNDKKG